MTRYDFEVSLSVHHHGRDILPGREGVELATMQAKKEIEELGFDPGQYDIAVTFQEFDSPNDSHASAYYLVTLRGDVSSFSQAYKESIGL